MQTVIVRNTETNRLVVMSESNLEYCKTIVSNTQYSEINDDELAFYNSISNNLTEIILQNRRTQQ